MIRRQRRLRQAFLWGNRVLSWVLKLFSVGCFVYGVAFALEIQHERDLQTLYRAFPEFHKMLVTEALLLPFIVGILALGVSAFIDLQVLIRQRDL